MPPLPLLVFYCIVLMLGSLVGGWIPHVVRLTHTKMQLAMSFIGGAMLGVGLLHLLPHAYFEFGAIYPTVCWMLGGFLLMFFIERVFHFHHHDPPPDVAADTTDSEHASNLTSDTDGDIDHSAHHHAHAHDHTADHGHEAHDHAHGHSRKLGWVAALVGLSVHSLLDGVALAASVRSLWGIDDRSLLPGVAVFLAILFHKPFDSLALGTLTVLAGLSPRARHVVNLVFALSLPAGVVLLMLGQDTFGSGENYLGAALAFSAGTFLCISMSDLLPELQFHTHDRVKLSAALILGVVLAASMVALEEAQHDHGQHDHAPTSGAESHGADSHEHDHSHDDHAEPHSR